MIQRITNENLLKELKKASSDKKEVIEELNKRLTFKKFIFTPDDKKYLYNFLLESNKIGISRVINDLIKDETFIELLDSTDMSGSTIISLTNFCKRPRRTLLKKSKKIRDAILFDSDFISVEDLLYDLTKEEVYILREDFDIDNSLVNRGYRFDALREETINSIIEEPLILNLYDIETISEFANNYPNPKELTANDKFMNLYLSKIDDNYNYDNNIFKYLTKRQVEIYINKYKSDILNLHLLKDCSEQIQMELLNNNKIKELLLNCNNPLIINKMPKEFTVDFLVNQKNILEGLNYNLLSNLNKKDFTYIIQNNENIYQEILSKLKDPKGVDVEKCIKHLRSQNINDLYNNQILNFDIDTISLLAAANKKELTKVILNKNKITTHVINSVTIDEYDKLEKLINYLDLSIADMITILSNLEEVRDSKVLNNLLERIPQLEREKIYENSIVRKEILLEENYKLDNYSIRYLLNNASQIKDMPSHLIAKLLVNADLNLAKEILNNNDVLIRVFEYLSNNKPTLLEEIFKDKSELIEIFKKPELIKYYNRETLASIIKNLDLPLREELCSNELITKILDNDQELITIYKKLQKMNKYLLNTLDFRLLNEECKNIKINILSQITKYPELQNYIVEIDKDYKISSEFITSINYLTNDFNYDNEITKIFKIINDSRMSDNKKYYGNLTKILNVIDSKELNKENFSKLINYLLYLIPRFDLDNKTSRPIVLSVPKTFNEIITYEERYNNNLTVKIKDYDHIKDNFILKHFKLTYNEALTMLNTYSIERLDRNIYQKDLEYLTYLNKIINTIEEDLVEMTDDYPVYSMYDSFVIENNLKKIYGNIYNYEIRSRSYLQKAMTKNIYGKDLNIYECPLEFMLLVANVNLKEEYEKTNSYFEAWHNTINKIDNYLDISLITNDKPIEINDITFGINGLLDNSVRLISSSHKLINKYMTPRELIDNTRDLKNTILVDKFAIRPNYNNSNYPNIEPDFIIANYDLLEDSNYLEKLSRASLEFKSKRNKNGLPIVVINYSKLVSSEKRKIDNLYKKYSKSQDMYDFESILTKLENNYSSYSYFSEELLNKFDLKELTKVLKTRIEKSGSICELEYLKELLKEEDKKFNNVIPNEKYKFETYALEGLIQDKIDFLND